MKPSTLSLHNVPRVARENRSGNQNPSILTIRRMYVPAFDFYLFSLAWQLDGHLTLPLVHTSDGDTSGDDYLNSFYTCGRNSRTGGDKHKSSASTSSGENSASNCISARSHPSASRNKVQSGRILSDKGSSSNQHSQGCVADLGITHSDDTLNSPLPRKQGTRGHVARGKNRS
jgi:hypothetical protein